MEVTFTASFCSNGAFSPFKANGDGGEVKWVSHTRWANQHHSGQGFELNLIWFRLCLDMYTKAHDHG
jgi:hypothetical protein